LTLLLLDRLLASAPARIVNVSSDAHRSARTFDWENLRGEKKYRGWQAYARSKLANIWFTHGLADRLDPSRLTANALAPGFVSTGFARHGDAGRLGALMMVLGRPFALSAPRGAETPVFLASAPEVEGLTDGYYAKCSPAQVSNLAADRDAANRLWDLSLELADPTTPTAAPPQLGELPAPRIRRGRDR
jgi:NAD(P)-dependent dehydrogenase (short-subunit alcohol dehydrogenase family)